MFRNFALYVLAILYLIFVINFGAYLENNTFKSSTASDQKDPAKISDHTYRHPVCIYEFTHIDRFKSFYTADILDNSLTNCEHDNQPQFPIG